ncbi:sarcosine oxidase subunit gamma [Chelativorans sp. YIM 93263]|uniref:sarcosine oxidase subunit gamma n=1 Tax=Chelativorans sp. YIM 93263 TaxID=2906648 RepID=UPI0023789CAF|nr:sarcosine oxidase subunit gamma family protein [Chelativorans sp. YIM 93263]
MVERQSPLTPIFRPAVHSNDVGSISITLSEVTPLSIVEAACWPGLNERLTAAIQEVTGLSVDTTPNAGVVGRGTAAFSIGPDRYLVSGEEDLSARLARVLSEETGTVTDLSHGRTTFRVSGTRAEWVLSKLFAIDFSPAVFPVGEGRATAHHDIFAQIQRSDAAQFDLYVFRSFARAFWNTLCTAAEEVGYEVIEA